jgi:hypothetical protein
MIKKSTWKTVEKKIAEEINKYFTSVGMNPIERIPILGRDGPDLTVNESGLLIDVKHRISNPKLFQFEDGRVAQSGKFLLAVKIKDIKLLAEGKDIDIMLKSSRVVRKYYEHMRDHSKKKKYLPDGNVIPCIILHYPGCKYEDSVLIIDKNDRSLLYERISNAISKHGSSARGKNKRGAKSPESNGDGEPEGGDI